MISDYARRRFTSLVLSLHFIFVRKNRVERMRQNAPLCRLRRTCKLVADLLLFPESVGSRQSRGAFPIWARGFAVFVRAPRPALLAARLLLLLSVLRNSCGRISL
jgi:hypothetical protein